MAARIHHHVPVIGHSSVDESSVGRRNPRPDVELRPERGRRDHRQQRAKRHLQDSHRHLKETILNFILYNKIDVIVEGKTN